MAEYFDREQDRTFTRVYKAETPDILQSFLRFDISGLPANATVSAARLRLEFLSP